MDDLLIYKLTAFALAICIAVIGFIYLVNGKLLERFTQSNLTFWGVRQTAKFIVTDGDRWIRGMTRAEIDERSALTHRSVAIAGALAATSFNPIEQSLVRAAAGAADSMIVTLDRARFPTIDLVATAMAPWTFALTMGSAYEGGQPHSRQLDTGGFVIFLTTDILQQDDLALRDTLMYLKIQGMAGCQKNVGIFVDPRRIPEVDTFAE